MGENGDAKECPCPSGMCADTSLGGCRGRNKATCLVRGSSEEKEAAPLGLHGSTSKTLREQKADVGKDQ